MSCSLNDLKAYFLGELAGPDRQTVEQHMKTCQGCRDELERLHLTKNALLGVPDEEIPRKIAFVSDKVLEPNWWQSLWHSAPKLGFASAAMLSVAILAHALLMPPAAQTPPPFDVAVIESQIASRVSSEVQQAVQTAVEESEARQAQRTAALLVEAGRQFEFQRTADLVSVEENFNILRKQVNRMYIASSDLGGVR